MPAAAVIPAPVAYIKVAAVKKLVVGFLVGCASPALNGAECRYKSTIFLESLACHSLGWACAI